RFLCGGCGPGSRPSGDRRCDHRRGCCLPHFQPADRHRLCCRRPAGETLAAGEFMSAAVARNAGRRAILPHWATLPVVFGGIIVLLWIVVGITIPLWAPYDPTMLAGGRFQPPNASHWLGT